MTKYMLFICLVLYITSCGDEEVQLVEQINLSYEFTINNQAITLGQTYELNGSTVMFETANYYAHGLRMGSQNEGAIITNELQHMLAGIDKTSRIVDLNIEANTIIATRLIIGVNESSNDQSEIDFTERTEDDPLSLQDPSMHWNWNSGYKFVRFDGEVDTDDDGIVDTPIAYHIGSNPLRKVLAIDTNLTLEAGENQVLLSMDLNEFFEGVDFQLEENWDTHTGNNLVLAQQLFANMDSAFSLVQ